MQVDTEKHLEILQQRTKHNYTSEIELKSLLIRVQNRNACKIIGAPLTKEDKIHNTNANVYIKIFNKLQHDEDYYVNMDPSYLKRVKSLKKKLKDRIVNLSERAQIDETSYENFGNILLLMIKNILKKHSFSGYSYRDDFYSDAVHKILKYLHNFDHKMISERTGTEVNSFAYISQIIHNSIIFIIKQKNKEQENVRNVISLEILYGEHDLKQHKSKADMFSKDPQIEEANEYYVKVDCLKQTTLFQIISDLNRDLIEPYEDKKQIRVVVEYPKDHRISMSEYDELRPLLKGNFSIVRAK